MTYYWGPPTSSIDWCESNYTASPFIAEFYNTISSMAIVLVGIFGILMHNWPRRRFPVALACISVVGVGSVMFHATLLKQWQWLDEVPMLYSALSFGYIIICQRYKLTDRQSFFLALILTVHAIITTLLVTMSTGNLQFRLFHMSFGTMEIYALSQLGMLLYDRKCSKGIDGVVLIGIYGFIAYLTGVAVWSIDLFFCPSLQNPFNPQLHAWWHVFVSIGLYCMAVVLLVLEAEHQKKAQSVEWRYLLPLVRLKDAK